MAVAYGRATRVDESDPAAAALHHPPRKVATTSQRGKYGRNGAFASVAGIKIADSTTKVLAESWAPTRHEWHAAWNYSLNPPTY
jgi:hypothetical protein